MDAPKAFSLPLSEIEIPTTSHAPPLSTHTIGPGYATIAPLAVCALAAAVPGDRHCFSHVERRPSRASQELAAFTPPLPPATDPMLLCFHRIKLRMVFSQPNLVCPEIFRSETILDPQTACKIAKNRDDSRVPIPGRLCQRPSPFSRILHPVLNAPAHRDAWF